MNAAMVHPPSQDDGSWALTPQDHAVVQVHRTLKQHRAGLKNGLTLAGLEVAAVGALGALGMLPQPWLAAGLTAGITLAVALPLAHWAAVKPFLDALGPDGPDVTKLRAIFRRELRDQRLVSRFLTACTVFCAAAGVLESPAFLGMAAVSAFGVATTQWARRHVEDHLRQLGAPPSDK